MVYRLVVELFGQHHRAMEGNDCSTVVRIGGLDIRRAIAMLRVIVMTWEG
jgi:hypothetical protein